MTDQKQDSKGASEQDTVGDIQSVSFKSLADQRRAGSRNRRSQLSNASDVDDDVLSNSATQASPSQVKVSRRRADSLGVNAQRPQLSSIMGKEASEKSSQPQLMDLFFANNAQKKPSVTGLANTDIQNPLAKLQTLSLTLSDPEQDDTDFQAQIDDLSIADVIDVMMHVDELSLENSLGDSAREKRPESIVSPLSEPVLSQQTVKQSAKRLGPFVFSDAFDYKSLEALDDEFLELLDIEFTNAPDNTITNTATQYYPVNSPVDCDAKGHIKSASLSALVDVIIQQQCDSHSLSQDDQFDFDVLLLTYLYFVEPLDMARLFILRYLQCTELIMQATGQHLVTQKKHGLTLFRHAAKIDSASQQVANQDDVDKNVVKQLVIQEILRKWIESDYHEQFERNQRLCKLMVKFIKSETSGGSKKFTHLQAILPKLEKLLLVQQASDKALSKVNCGGSTNCELTLISKVNADDFAKELSLFEMENFRVIKLSELFQQAWSHKDKSVRELLALNLLAFCSFFNRIAYGVATQVVSVSKLKDRVEVLKTFIYIANECVKLCNYNSCFEIVAGLNLGAVSRMKMTWKSLPKKYHDAWLQLNMLVTNQGNYKVYRQALQQLQDGVNCPPIVPYLGMFLSDLTFIEDGNQTYMNVDGPVQIINYQRCTMLSNVFRIILLYQQKSYSFASISSVKDYLLSSWKVVGEAELYNLSKKNEPSNSQTESSSMQFKASISGLMSASAKVGGPAKNVLSVNSTTLSIPATQAPVSAPAQPVSSVSSIVQLKQRVRAMTVSNQRPSIPKVE